MNVELGEIELDRLNKKIIFMCKVWAQIRVGFIKKVYVKYINKTIEKRNQVFIELREATREKYPERFS